MLPSLRTSSLVRIASGDCSLIRERRYLKRQVDDLAGQWSALPRPIQWETVRRFVIQQDDLQAQMKVRPRNYGM